MSLSEKAKTLPEWHGEVRKKGETDCGSCLSIGTKDACSDCTVILNFHPKFVRLEDARQEIDRLEKENWILQNSLETLKKSTKTLLDKLQKHLNKLERGRVEQKQKLEQLFKDFDCWFNPLPLSILQVEDGNRLRDKLLELLKE